MLLQPIIPLSVFSGKAKTKSMFLLTAFCALSCSEKSAQTVGDAGAKGGEQQVASEGGTSKQLDWIITNVDPERAGLHAVLASHGSQLGVAYYRELKDSAPVNCPNASASKPRPAFDLYYLAYNGTDWETPIKIDRTIGVTYGLSLAIDHNSGKTYIGYLGGAESEVECSSSDAMIADSSDGKTWNKHAIGTNGPIGDTVGYWTSVALTNNGEPHAAYGDVHFGYYEEDGKAKASLRYDSEVVVANSGAGIFNRLVFDSQNQPLIAFYNPVQKGTKGGLQLARKLGNTWQFQQLVNSGVSQTNEIGFTGDGKGRLGLSYYEPSQKLLHYLESMDGWSGWVDTKVDESLTQNGEFSSMAYDSKGNPGISYYRCGGYTQNQCDPTKDAVMFAYRKNGQWETYQVDDGQALNCGTYTALTFDDKDIPTIAYQCIVLNNITNEFVQTLKTARAIYR